MKIFRQSSRDLYAVIVCASYPALLLACATAFWDVPLALQLALVLGLSVFWQSGSYAYHFHNHANFFVSPALNRAFEVLCSAAWKMPVSREAYYHFIHHTPRFLATRDSYDGVDPLLGTVRHCGLSSPRTLFYNAFDWFGLRWFLGMPYLIARSCRGGTCGGTLTDPKFFSWHRKSDDEPWEFTAFAHHRGQLRQVWLECGAIVVFNAVLLLLDPFFYIAVYAPLHFVAYFIYDYMDFSEHFLTDLRHDQTLAVSSYNRFYNWVMFNGGYHAEHHWHAGVHWSKLPEVTRELPPEGERRVVPYSTLLSPLLPPRPLVTPSSTLRLEPGWSLSLAEDGATGLLALHVCDAQSSRAHRRVLPSALRGAAESLCGPTRELRVRELCAAHPDAGERDLIALLDWLRRLRALDLVFDKRSNAGRKERSFPTWSNYPSFD